MNATQPTTLNLARARWVGLLLAALLLALILAGCNQDDRQAASVAPPTAAPLGPSVTPTSGAVQPSSSPTEIPPSPTFTLQPPTATPAAVPHASTPTSIAPTATASRMPPSATPTPEPTAESLPTATPLPAAGTHDPAAVQVALQRIVSGLEAPLGIAHAGDGSQRLFIMEKAGRIRIVQNGALATAPFLDIRDRVGSSASEQGLLGLAFHPQYAANGFFFLNYTDRQGDTVVARFSVSTDPERADPASERVLLTLDQPAGNHNGGHLAFGPDGYLYIGTGDGGGAGDRYGNGQNGQTLLGAMLRLDVDRGQPYAVPADNPFVGNPAVRDEIWAIGLRNPWRYAFDRLSGDLIVADVGQNQYEEVNVQRAGSPGGQNYGWPIMEATHCFPQDRPCDPAGLTLPVVEYDHSLGCSVTGGYVYRGQAFPLLSGIYLFGDYCSGRIWGMAQDATGEWRLAEVAQTGIRPSSFGEDEGGELYVVDIAGGELHRITARPR